MKEVPEALWQGYQMIGNGGCRVTPFLRPLALRQSNPTPPLHHTPCFALNRGATITMIHSGPTADKPIVQNQNGESVAGTPVHDTIDFMHPTLSRTPLTTVDRCQISPHQTPVAAVIRASAPR